MSSPTPTQLDAVPAGHPPSLSRALGEVWSIAWPTILTMTSYTVMQFTDSLMVGQVGPLELAAQGNGGIWAFTLMSIAYGMLTIVNTFVSQHLGAGRPERGAQYGWAAIWLSLTMWVATLLPFALALPLLFDVLHANRADGAELVRLESIYGQVLLLGAIFTLGARGIHHYFFGLHRPKIVTVSAIAGNITNILVNYALIFGEAGLPALNLPGVPGAPQLGLLGAAIGTVCGTAVEFAIPFAIFLGPKMNAEFKTRSAWRPRLKPVRDLVRVGWPSSLQFGNEIVCWAIFMSVIVGMFGDHHMAAGWIALRYMHLSFMPAVGASVAVTSLVGKYIGAQRPDLAMHRARIGLALAMLYMTICAVVFLVFRHQLVGLFIGGDIPAEEAAELLRLGGMLMICAAVFQTADALGIIYTGALRGAGDTVWPGVVTVIYSWLFIVLGGYVMAKAFPQLESIGPWISAALFIIAFGVTMAVRFERGRWRSIKLIDHAAGADDDHDASLRSARHDAERIAPLEPTPPGGPGGSIADLAEEMAECIAAKEAE